jgi:ATP-binding cassette subfamily F protein uup
VAKKPAAAEPQAPRPVAEAPKKKLSYLEQREWDGMEAKILEAEQELALRQHELQESASDGKKLTEAYGKMQEAQRRVDDLYARWADLEAKLPG